MQRTPSHHTQLPCPDHPPGRAPYRTREWKALRELVYQRDQGCCRACGSEVRGKDWRLGHEAPHRGDLALFWEQANLLLLCKRCSQTGRRVQEPRVFGAALEAAWPTRDSEG